MKRLKLRGRELEKIGYPAGKISSMIIGMVHREYRKSQKPEVIELLKELINNPSHFRKHPVFGEIAMELTKPQPVQKKYSKQSLITGSREYVCYGREFIEEEAIQQMETAMRLPISLKGALMADAHCGYGLPIGGVLATDNAVIPYGVGMDIGCRMCLSVYALSPENLDSKKAVFKDILIANTRFGTNEFPGKKEHKVIDRKEFKEIKFLKSLKEIAYKQLGTSGSGNHFVEIGKIEIGNNIEELHLNPGEYLAVLSHSGSRNMGANIARHYTSVAKQVCPLPKGAVNLAWLSLDSEEGQEYWQAMNLAGDYARANHQLIHERIAKALGEKPVARVENHHNFAWKEKLEDGTEVIVHRKGATPATNGIFGVIPGSMTLPGFVVKGKGNSQSINSASHGAGRQMSRSVAKRKFTQKDLKQALERAGVELIGGDLDEAPGAYKNIHAVMGKQKDLVDIKAIFYPKIVRMDG